MVQRWENAKREISCGGGRELDGDVCSLFWFYPAVVMRETKIAISAVKCPAWANYVRRQLVKGDADRAAKLL